MVEMIPLKMLDEAPEHSGRSSSVIPTPRGCFWPQYVGDQQGVRGIRGGKKKAARIFLTGSFVWVFW